MVNTFCISHCVHYEIVIIHTNIWLLFIVWVSRWAEARMNRIEYRKTSKTQHNNMTVDPLFRYFF